MPRDAIICHTVEYTFSVVCSTLYSIYYFVSSGSGRRTARMSGCDPLRMTIFIANMPTALIAVIHRSLILGGMKSEPAMLELFS